MLRYRSLGSGSGGNATIITQETGQRTTRLLVDCGLGLQHLLKRMETAGLQAERIDAIFITHEHGDHIGSAAAFSKRYNTPVWMSAGTHAGTGWQDFGPRLNMARDGQAFEVGALRVTPFTVPHDAREPLQLTCTDGQHTLGILTDLGHASAHALQHLVPCHSLLLECNHDADLLAQSAYPEFLKRRVGGRLGHLTNTEAARIAKHLAGNGCLRQVTAAHLSERNNSPELARAHIAQALDCSPGSITVADPVHGTDWIDVVA